MAGTAPAGAAPAIDFERCSEDPDFVCGEVEVPLDHSGERPGTIELEVRRHAPADEPDPAGKPVLMALAGGPGQSATAVGQTFAITLGPLLGRYQLIVFDQRGTGLSGALSCAALEGEVEDLSPAAGICAEQLGPERELYGTVDSVADMESVRQALGVGRMAVYGVSYGTYVASLYAQAHPQRIDRLILDSVAAESGFVGPYQRALFRAVRRIAREQCREGRCRGVTPDAVSDLERLARRLRAAPLRGTLRDGSGDPERRSLRGDKALFDLAIAGDLNPALRAGAPAAIRSAVVGDTAPLLRIASIAEVPGLDGRAGPGLKPPEDESLRAMSNALFAATLCADTSQPWSLDTPRGATRARLLRQGLARIPYREIEPFGRRAVAEFSHARTCVRWPATPLPPAPPLTELPDVPALILNGTADVRTPVESALQTADLLPRAQTLLVAGTGHSVVGQDLGASQCTRLALGRFAAEEPIGDPCAGVDNAHRVRPRAPTSLRHVPRAHGLPWLEGRALTAAVQTVEDLRWTVSVATAANVTGRLGVGGLRGGSVILQLGPEGLVARLRSLSYVPGVRLSGTLRPRGGPAPLSGLVHLRGPGIQGLVSLRPDGSLAARINGRTVRHGPLARLARAPATTAPRGLSLVR